MKFNTFLMSLLCVTLLLNMQCQDDTTILPQSNCVSFTLIDSYSYENAATSSCTINNVSINEYYIIINVTATACDGSVQTMQLLDFGNASDSNPPQRYVILFSQ